MKALGYEKAHPVGEFALELIDAPGKTGHRPQDGRLAGVAALRLTSADHRRPIGGAGLSRTFALGGKIHPLDNATHSAPDEEAVRLVAMAGKRLHVPGVDGDQCGLQRPAYRRHRLGTRLLPAVAAGIRDRGETRSRTFWSPMWTPPGGTNTSGSGCARRS
jgi:hypothetical protein